MSARAEVEAEIESTCSALDVYRLGCRTELILQDAIASALARRGVAFDREHILDRRSRVDFLIGGRIALEVKIDGSISSVLEQLFRYAEHPKIAGLLLVTTRAQHANIGSADDLLGKPLRVYRPRTALGF